MFYDELLEASESIDWTTLPYRMELHEPGVWRIVSCKGVLIAMCFDEDVARFWVRSSPAKVMKLTKLVQSSRNRLELVLAHIRQSMDSMKKDIDRSLKQ